MADGSIYQGVMIDWMPHGIGTLTSTNGSSQFGVFKGSRIPLEATGHDNASIHQPSPSRFISKT
jgi:hypothetical protein